MVRRNVDGAKPLHTLRTAFAGLPQRMLPNLGIRLGMFVAKVRTAMFPFGPPSKPPPSSESSSRLPSVPPLLRRRILIVEDDEASGRLLARFLSRQYETIIATDGLEGLAMASAVPAPDVIVADVEMPRMDGFEMAKALKGSPLTHDIPIIFLTARADAKDVIEGIASGARNYVTKPVSIEELEAKVRRALHAR
jgi:CheY-like chemotaxis protein